MLKRIISALIGIPLVLLLVYCGGLWFLGLVILAALLGIKEFFMLLETRWRVNVLTRVAGYGGILLLLAGAYAKQDTGAFSNVIIVFILFSLVMIVMFSRLDLEELTISFWGTIYIGGLFSFLILLREMEHGKVLVITLLAGIWLYDSLAYFAGIKWGKTRILPEVSPKKSVQGAIGGTVAVLGSVILFYSGWGEYYPLDFFYSMIFGVIIILGAPLGDFLESALKRKLQVKDTGNLIPGHGGILDRVDSVIFTAPLVYFFVQLID